MYVGRITYEGVTAYLDGYDHACGGALLSGFREWLADTEKVVRNLTWSAQVLRVVFSEGRPAEPWSEDEHGQAVAGLFALLEGFFGHLASRHATTTTTTPVTPGGA
ncbi:hypothetical protein [Streptomyces sp. NPDC003077]|uniref:hypothetical protein n=1 Tax=Streptomyces sp. NPDC003077 TaxID=3154443 RepID=UPI0033A04487